MCSIEWWHCRWPSVPYNHPTSSHFLQFAVIHSFVIDEPGDFIFGTLTYHSTSHPAEKKSSLKGAWSGSKPYVISPQRLMLETSDFVHGSTMWNLSLVLSECCLNGHAQGHVSNFNIVNLETFATASRRYTGDIHSSIVFDLFTTPEIMGVNSAASRLSAHCLSCIASDYISNFIPSTESGLVV